MESAVAVPLRLFLARVGAGLLLLLYLLALFFSHSVPLSSALEIPFAFTGWLALPCLSALIPSGTHQGGRAIMFPAWCWRWRWIPHVAFLAAAVLALYFAFTGNLSTACPDHATSCIKIDDWSMSGGHYYRRFPYDSQGNDDPGAPWVEISRQVYVAELGTRLREAALFGVFMVCGVWPPLFSGREILSRLFRSRSAGPPPAGPSAPAGTSTA